MTAAPKAPGEGNALIFIDLDRFKFINDTFGHGEGDRALKAAAPKPQVPASLHRSIMRAVESSARPAAI